MTPAQKSAAQKAGGIGAITLFMLGANWAMDRVEHRGVDERYITRIQWVADSVRRDAAAGDATRTSAEILRRLEEMSQRLREICEGVRRGCR